MASHLGVFDFCFFGEENFKILRKKAKNGLSPGVFLREEGFTPGGGF